MADMLAKTKLSATVSYGVTDTPFEVVPLQISFAHGSRSPVVVLYPKPDISGRNTPRGSKWVLDNQRLPQHFPGRPSGFVLEASRLLPLRNAPATQRHLNTTFGNSATTHGNSR